ncbi:legumain [Nematostella vectensis]|uniref:legumain n=1 Tax=Nematostella vectensis TaxID=45351 RepID=UPI00207773D0|nr:legumain [Nematostella vectensis]
MANWITILAFLSLLLICVATEDEEFSQKSSTPSEEGKHWALLVAGSSSWMNYRHQADICHAYQVLHSHGIPDENIVVMMYDDIAHNAENPTPGIIINRPNGSDVYHGVVKDYTRDDVTPEKFLEVLKGNKEYMKHFGSGKVIDSGPNDHVFVFFSDHGAPGLIAFPGLDNVLTAQQLNKAIKYMHKNNKYKKMVVYIEACESGSMFRKLLPDDIKVYATTASSYNESSYACYFDQKRRTYLGDVYSVKWMENSDKANLDVESLLQQFKIIKRETNTSHVQKFGDMSFDKDPLDEYQGEGQATKLHREPVGSLPEAPYDAVPSPDVPIEILKHRLAAATTEVERQQLTHEISALLQMREKIKATVKQIASHVIASDSQMNRVLMRSAEPVNYNCYEAAIHTFGQNCFHFNEHEYALRHLYVLSNLCEEGIPTESIVSAINGVCGSQ